MPDAVLIALFFLFVGFLGWRERCHDRERRDLYNRIMAANLTEYKLMERKEQPKARNFVRKGLEQGICALSNEHAGQGGAEGGE